MAQTIWEYGSEELTALEMKRAFSNVLDTSETACLESMWQFAASMTQHQVCAVHEK